MIPQRNANPSAVVSATRTFFVTSSTADKRSLFQVTRMAELFVKVLFEYRDQNKFRLHDFVLMRDHFHLLLTLGPETTVERAVQFIKGGFSFRAGRELDFHGAVWQRGFSEVRVLDDASFSPTSNTQETIPSAPTWRTLLSAILIALPTRDIYWTHNPRG